MTHYVVVYIVSLSMLSSKLDRPLLVDSKSHLVFAGHHPALVAKLAHDPQSSIGMDTSICPLRHLIVKYAFDHFVTMVTWPQPISMS